MNKSTQSLLYKTHGYWNESYASIHFKILCMYNRCLHEGYTQHLHQTLQTCCVYKIKKTILSIVSKAKSHRHVSDIYISRITSTGKGSVTSFHVGVCKLMINSLSHTIIMSVQGGK